MLITVVASGSGIGPGLNAQAKFLVVQRSTRFTVNSGMLIHCIVLV